MPSLLTTFVLVSTIAVVLGQQPWGINGNAGAGLQPWGFNGNAGGFNGGPVGAFNNGNGMNGGVGGFGQNGGGPGGAFNGNGVNRGVGGFGQNGGSPGMFNNGNGMNGGLANNGALNGGLPNKDNYQASGCGWDFLQSRCTDSLKLCQGGCQNFGTSIFSDCRCVPAPFGFGK